MSLERTKLYFVTANQDKFLEARLILPQLEQLNLELPEIQELNSRVIIEHKLNSARAARPACSILVDDTALHLECLGGLPGPLIKWFLKALGPAGLAQLAQRGGNSRARAVTLAGVAFAQSDDLIFSEGSMLGRIVEPKGQGFGWDNIFLPDGAKLTYGEMSREEKLRISPRGQALPGLSLAQL